MKPALQEIVETMTIQELVETRDEFDVLITEKQEDEKDKLLETFRELAEQAGLSVADVVAKLQPAPTGNKPNKVRNPAKPKYQNPEDESQTWSGRGRRPHWVQEFLSEKGWIEVDKEEAEEEEVQANKEEVNNILAEILIEQV